MDFSTIRVDCVTVSTLPVKSSVDDHLQRLYDALLGALRHSIQADFNSITNFLTGAKESLSIKPQSVEEIGEVNQKHSELLAKKPEVCTYVYMYIICDQIKFETQSNLCTYVHAYISIWFT